MADGNGDGSDRPIVLLPNGMVRIDLGTPDEPVEVMWRRPKIGELRRFDEKVDEINDAIGERARQVQADQQAAAERAEAVEARHRSRMALTGVDEQRLDELERTRLADLTADEQAECRALTAARSEALAELTDEQHEQREAWRAEKAAFDSEQIAASKKRNRELRWERDRLRAEWISEVDAALNMKPDRASLGGDPDDMPAILLDAKLIGDLLDHWRTRPFRPVHDG